MTTRIHSAPNLTFTQDIISLQKSKSNNENAFPTSPFTRTPTPNSPSVRSGSLTPSAFTDLAKRVIGTPSPSYGYQSPDPEFRCVTPPRPSRSAPPGGVLLADILDDEDQVCDEAITATISLIEDTIDAEDLGPYSSDEEAEAILPIPLQGRVTTLKLLPFSDASPNYLPQAWQIVNNDAVLDPNASWDSGHSVGSETRIQQSDAQNIALQADRYIPLRSTHSSFAYEAFGSSNARPTHYQMQLRASLWSDLNPSVLRFNNTQTQVTTHSAPQQREVAYLPTSPTKIFHAPDLGQSYHYHLISANDAFMALGLGTDLYIQQRKPDNIMSLIPSVKLPKVIEIPLKAYFDDEGEVISSLHFISESRIAVCTAVENLSSDDVISAKEKLIIVQFAANGHFTVKVTKLETRSDTYCIANKGNRIYTGGGDDGTIRVFDSQTYKQVFHTGVDPELGEGGCVCKILPHPTRDIVAVGRNDNIVCLYDTNDMRMPLKRYRGHEGAVKALAFLGRDILVSGGGSNDRKLIFWDLNTDQKIQEFDMEGQVTGIEYINHQILAVSGGYLINHTRFFYLPDPRKPIIECQNTTVKSDGNEYGDNRVISTTSHSNQLYTVSTDDKLRVYDFTPESEKRAERSRPTLFERLGGRTIR